MPRRAIPTVSIHIVRGAFAEAIARGQQPAALCAMFGVSPEQFADPEARVGVDVMRRIWHELPRLVGVEDFGLAVARRAETSGALSLVRYLARSAATVGDGLRIVLRYQRLIQDAFTNTWIPVGDSVRIVSEERDPAFPLPRNAIEFGLAWVLSIARGTTSDEFAPVQIEFRHPRPADDAAQRSVFRCKLVYDAPHNAVTVRQSDLDLPHLTADPDLSELLDRQARGLEQRLPLGDSFSSKVRRALSNALADGEPTLKTIAARLGVSERTAQRRLRDEGTSHRRVLDELRRDLAVHHMDEPRLGIQEVAFVLGFADQSAFNHAFKRWTGMAPGVFRKRER